MSTSRYTVIYVALFFKELYIFSQKIHWVKKIGDTSYHSKKTAWRRTYHDCLGNNQFFIFRLINLSDKQCPYNLPFRQVSSCFLHGIIISSGLEKVRSFFCIILSFYKLHRVFTSLTFSFSLLLNLIRFCRHYLNN